MHMENHARGQAALDFMMTYGWALMLIALAAAALAALGVLDPGTFVGSRATGFSQVQATDWQLSNSTGMLQMRLRNSAGTGINVTFVDAKLLALSRNSSSVVPIGDGEYGLVNISFSPLGLSKGSSYSIKVSIQYADAESGMAYSDSGTITGRVN